MELVQFPSANKEVDDVENDGTDQDTVFIQEQRRNLNKEGEMKADRMQTLSTVTN